jgi:hypothetical protein
MMVRRIIVIDPLLQQLPRTDRLIRLIPMHGPLIQLRDSKLQAAKKEQYPCPLHRSCK